MLLGVFVAILLFGGISVLIAQATRKPKASRS